MINLSESCQISAVFYYQAKFRSGQIMWLTLYQIILHLQ